MLLPSKALFKNNYIIKGENGEPMDEAGAEDGANMVKLKTESGDEDFDS